MVQAYFGRRWDAPAWDDAIPVSVPIGRSCAHCSQSIEDNDDGILMGAVKLDAAGTPVHASQCAHAECHLRAVLGDTRHLEGRCRCAGHIDEDPTTDTSWRAEARATVQWLIDHGRGRWCCSCHGECRCQSSDAAPAARALVTVLTLTLVVAAAVVAAVLLAVLL